MRRVRESAPVDLAPSLAPLVAQLQARGLAGSAAALLDAFEPLTILGAQALFIAQPIAGLAGGSWRTWAGDLAAALETPGGVSALRQALREAEGPRRD
jgi:hypothetical protein